MGTETGVSEWITVDQSRINAFAACTEDFQFIHIDPVEAKEKAGFESTIAHGFLVFSLLSHFAVQAAVAYAKRAAQDGEYADGGGGAGTGAVGDIDDCDGCIFVQNCPSPKLLSHCVWRYGYWLLGPSAY